MMTREVIRDVAAGISREISYYEQNGWSIDFTKGELPTGMSFSRASGGSVFDAAGSLAVRAANEPRLDFDPVTYQSRGLLIEEQRTNHLRNSTAPVSQTVTLAAGNYTLWVAGTGSCAVAAGTAVGSGFGMAVEGAAVTFSVTTAGTVVFDVSESLSCFQCENGVFATSLIITTTAAATRSAELCSVPLESWFNPLEGTLMVECIAGTTVGNRMMAMLGSNNNNAITLGGYPSNNSFSVRVDNTVLANQAFTPVVAAGVLCRMAGAYAVGASQSAVNGVVSGITANASLPPFTTLRIGCRMSDQMFNGWIRRIVYVPNRMNAAQLIDLTKV
ncbi:MAG: hypothetical protein EON60_02970 [Alphaproteobacteria bacterium]|nr:MAG: hypothetical protein EON60_02970 [Alphaproteobacteria bacterium]